MDFLLPRWTRVFHDVLVTPVLGDWCAAPDEPPDYGVPVALAPDDFLPLTFWLDGHPIASQWHPSHAYARVRDAGLFDAPLSVHLCAALPCDVRGWMRVQVSAFGCTDAQLQSVLDLYAEAGVDARHVGAGRLGLMLGHHWIRAPELAWGAEAGALLDSFRDAAERAFALVLVGTEEEAAGRLLRSIPGIHGERSADGP